MLRSQALQSHASLLMQVPGVWTQIKLFRASALTHWAIFSGPLPPGHSRGYPTLRTISWESLSGEAVLSSSQPHLPPNIVNYKDKYKPLGDGRMEPKSLALCVFCFFFLRFILFYVCVCTGGRVCVHEFRCSLRPEALDPHGAGIIIVCLPTGEQGAKLWSSAAAV